MLIVVSHDRSFLSTAVVNLASRCAYPVVAAPSVGLAISLLEDNDVAAVLTHGLAAAHPVTRSIGRRFPHVGCMSVPSPVDWGSIAATVHKRFPARREADCVVAQGLEELLGLLGLTRRAASIDVTAGASYGQLTVCGGHITSARAGADEGHAAAIRILGWADTHVKSSPPKFADRKPTMRLSISAALHEAAHRRDELGRLASRADVGALMSALERFSGFSGALVADADNRVAFVERGSLDEFKLRRLWQGVEMCASLGKAIGFWDPSGVVVASPLGGHRVLVAASLRRDELARLRARADDVADGLQDVIEAVCTMENEVALVASLKWSS